MRRALMVFIVLGGLGLGAHGDGLGAHGLCIRARYAYQMDRPWPATWVRRPVTVADAMAVGQEWEPKPGNPGHKEPPPGWYCSPGAKDAAHRCDCHRECRESDVGEDGESQPGLSIVEDPKCLVFCRMDHCHCPVDCP